MDCAKCVARDDVEAADDDEGAHDDGEQDMEDDEQRVRGGVGNGQQASPMAKRPGASESI